MSLIIRDLKSRIDNYNQDFFPEEYQNLLKKLTRIINDSISNHYGVTLMISSPCKFSINRLITCLYEVCTEYNQLKWINVPSSLCRTEKLIKQTIIRILADDNHQNNTTDLLFSLIRDLSYSKKTTIIVIHEISYIVQDNTLLYTLLDKIKKPESNNDREMYPFVLILISNTLNTDDYLERRIRSRSGQYKYFIGNGLQEDKLIKNWLYKLITFNNNTNINQDLQEHFYNFVEINMVKFILQI